MSKDQDKESDQLQELLKTTAAQVGEHFDSVIIIATKTYNGDDFVRHKASSGSIYTNYGAVKEWMLAYEEGIRENARKDHED